jgi:hypothetical protein
VAMALPGVTVTSGARRAMVWPNRIGHQVMLMSGKVANLRLAVTVHRWAGALPAAGGNGR